MDTTLLKSFATSARTELIREVAARITAVLAPGSPERVEQPRAVSELERAISVGGGGDKGKAHVTDKVAYTWFNRIIALRFMDANGYTGIGVVSPAADQVGQPEILAAAKRGQVDGDVVKGANVATVTGLLNGTRQPRPGVDAQAEAYSLLLADYCRYWNRAMPFMFEREGDFTELLIPANVLAEDSVLSRSVTVLTEEVCQDVEVIGWLYQFYISERKDEVFAGFKKNKKAGADEIPAATQLFTPHWIVRYLVENSVGRLWMLNHPESRLIEQMDYYIAPVDEETDFLKITKPEELTVIDPACGSGHMLTYAFDLLYAIYEEEGYTPSQIPGLILTNNLYGTEIDPRAGALAAFALTMKATAKRKLFLKNPVAPNICVLEPISFSADELSYLVTKDGDRRAEEAFWNQFAEADIVGSLIQPDPVLALRLANHIARLDDGGDILRANAIDWAHRQIRQAEFLAPRYSVVVANPPYMGMKNASLPLLEYLKNFYANFKSDLFSAFVKRSADLCVRGGYAGIMSPNVWMYISAHAELRRLLLDRHGIQSLIELPLGGFDSATVQICAFTFVTFATDDRPATFVRLVNTERGKDLAVAFRESVNDRTSFNCFEVERSAFRGLPGEPLVYWVAEVIAPAFANGSNLASVAYTRIGLITGDNNTYIREWFEVSRNEIGIDFARQEAADSGLRWFPISKGGEYRKWYGNISAVLDWKDDGKVLQTRMDPTGMRVLAHNFNLDDIFHEGVTWSKISTGRFSGRYQPRGFIFNDPSAAIFPRDNDVSVPVLLAYLSSSVADYILRALNPTLNFQPGNVSSLPWSDQVPRGQVETLAEEARRLAKEDWDEQETSLDFTQNYLVGMKPEGRVADAVAAALSVFEERASHLARIEQRNNETFAYALGLGDAVPVEVSLKDVTLNSNPDWAHSGLASAAARRAAASNRAVHDLASYAVGCMFGRYSLDEPGLILADQGATLQDYLAKVPSPTFEPDADNVIPIVDGDWFEDDIIERFRQFLRAAFGEQYFEENLQFVTKSLGVKQLRDYFVKSFYKDHVKRYKKRPIYWLFSSPKGSFNALIYMHRYTPSTVSTVLTYLREYVTKLESALQQAERAGNAKEADRLRKILVELNEYEHDTLFPKASENVVIDLDDGVKVNYPKFGAALKKIPGLEAASD
ncbi:BREX-1 system adenine-specific DNA-methyltransferase PglX [Leucobacter triazinivorans]|uniref:site-specific DNA-methyltransferase (adenine-specific) n=1 Tax=Leucobacter triazinivorans TaxID=1784719 RepID=A0A4P6KC58_9MICO|nr:BREX-1 system adenine-specific DNA-methyltransferase PglX [Leucobacter triazinivorans]QBE47683.1 BREX-1 system adenine-specific DNA-methyltransferase PglX [Leucobacter triazinivorans]